MSEIMLLGILRMPLPDSPADMGVMEWMQVKDRMRQAADELEKARAELEGHLQLIEVLEEQRDAALARAEAAERERDEAREAADALRETIKMETELQGQLQGELAAAEAKVAKLREALTPFAEEAKFCDEQTEALGAAPINDDDSIDVSVGDLRRARAVYEKIKGGGDE